MKPPMPYSGGKQVIASKIASLLPAHDGYVEPFAGALSVLLAKNPSSMEVVNDLNKDIMVFWRVLRERPDELHRVCALTPHSRAEYVAARGPASSDELEQARRVWVQLTQSRAAVMRHTSGWRFVHGGNRMPLAKYLDGYLGRIAPAAARLRQVSLECRPALDVIKTYGHKPNNLLYLDPPYLGATRSQNSAQYRHEMQDEAAHKELLQIITELPCAVAISGYPHPLYDETLSGWTRHEMPARSASGNPRTEILWCNRPPDNTFNIPTH